MVDPDTLGYSSSSSIYRSSASAIRALDASNLTVNSIPTRRSSPDLSSGRTFVLNRLQISGGIAPEIRSFAWLQRTVWAPVQVRARAPRANAQARLKLDAVSSDHFRFLALFAW